MQENDNKDKTIADLEAKLAEQQECSLKASADHNLDMQIAKVCIKDLEAKLAESEKKFNVANNLRKNSDEVLLNYKTEKYGLDKTIKELRKMKLSLPEKEWYYKGFENCERQMSSHIADLTLEFKELKQQLAEKEEQLKNAIRFKTPQIERFAVVQYIHWEKKPYKIVNCFDAYKDENMKTRYCFYGVTSTNFKVIEICDTKEEAQARLEELKGENK